MDKILSPSLDIELSRGLTVTELIILIHLVTTKVFLQYLLASTPPTDIRQPGNKNRVLKNAGPHPPTSSPFPSSFPAALIPSQGSRGFSHHETNRGGRTGAVLLFAGVNCELVI